MHAAHTTVSVSSTYVSEFEVQVMVSMLNANSTTFRVELASPLHRDPYNDDHLARMSVYLRDSLHLHLLDVWRPHSNAHGLTLTLRPSAQETESTLESLQAKLIRLERDLALSVLSVQREPYFAEETTAAFRHCETRQIVNAESFMQSSLLCSMSRHVLSRVIFFEKLRYFKYERLPLHEEEEEEKTNRVTIGFFLKMSARSSGGLLFDARILWSGRLVWLSARLTNDAYLELSHNISVREEEKEEKSRLRLDTQLEREVWYRVDLQLTSVSLDVTLLLSSENGATLNVSSIARAEVMSERRDDEFPVEHNQVMSLFVGGLDGERARNLNEVFYADDIYMASMRLNSFELFDEESVDHGSYIAMLNEQGPVEGKYFCKDIFETKCLI